MEIKEVQHDMLVAGKKIIDLLPYIYRVYVVEDLCYTRGIDYDEKLIERDNLKERLEYYYNIENETVRTHLFNQLYTILLVYYKKYKEYLESFIDFLKRKNLYDKNVKCKMKDGHFVYKDEKGYEKSF